MGVITAVGRESGEGGEGGGRLTSKSSHFKNGVGVHPFNGPEVVDGSDLNGVISVDREHCGVVAVACTVGEGGQGDVPSQQQHLNTANTQTK